VEAFERVRLALGKMSKAAEGWSSSGNNLPESHISASAATIGESTSGGGNSPRRGRTYSREVSEISSQGEFDTMDAGVDFYVPEPTFEVSELDSEEVTYNRIGREELVYKVSLDFGDVLGGWDIFVTRTALSSVISQVQVGKIVSEVTGRLVRSRSSSNHHNAIDALIPPSPRRRVGSQESIGSGVSQKPTAIKRKAQLFQQASVQKFSETAEDQQMEEQVAEETEENLTKLMSRLLFVPAIGNAARIKRVRHDRLKYIRLILQNLFKHSKIRQTAAVREFLQISPLTFDPRFGPSVREGWVRATMIPRSSESERLEWSHKVTCCCCVCACAPDPGRCAGNCQPTFRKNRRLWMIVKRSFIALYDKEPDEVTPFNAIFVLCLSRSSEVLRNYSTTGSKRTLKLVGDFSIISLKMSTRWMKNVWSKAFLEALRLTSNESGGIVPRGWAAIHEHQSFAPRRETSTHVGAELCRAKWHVDGTSYFKAVFDAISQAEEQIFIMGWWVVAHLPLLRPGKLDDDANNLVGLLKHKAKEGVQINILMYRCVNQVLPLDYIFQEKAFNNSPNISVLTHPEHSLQPGSVWYWSHHQKLCIVDQSHAFCGGIDLSWGRYDTKEHLLYDPTGDTEKPTFPGIDFSNVRVKDFSNVSVYDRQQHPSDCPRMPWHDVHSEWRGSIARDIARHFIVAWNHARFTLVKEKHTHALVPMDVLPLTDIVRDFEKEKREEQERIARAEAEMQQRHSHSHEPLGGMEVITEEESKDEISSGVESSQESQAGQSESGKEEQLLAAESTSSASASSISAVKDKESKDAENATEDVEDGYASESSERTITEEDLMSDAEAPLVPEKPNENVGRGPEMPDSDEGDEVNNDKGEESIAREEPEESAKEEEEDSAKEEEEDDPAPEVLKPGAPAEIVAQSRSASHRSLNIGEDSDIEHAESLLPEGVEASNSGKQNDRPSSQLSTKKKSKRDSLRIDVGEYESLYEWGFAVDAQCLQSRGLWAGAAPGETESSIERAMRRLIDNAEKFVYIENQFFISGLDSDPVIHNRVLDAMFERIVRAHRAGKEFKIYVTIPLLPGFPGLVNDSPSIRRILYFQFRTICRGEHSLFHNLLAAGVDPDEYISFFGLRTWQSKLDMKTEDSGSRNPIIATELIYVHSKIMIADDNAAIIGSGNINDRSLLGSRDTEFAVHIHDAKSLQVEGTDESFCRTFRMRIFKEHFGESEEMLKAFEEPWTKGAYQKIRERALQNAATYEDCFNIIPRNSIRTSEQLAKASNCNYTTIHHSHAMAKTLEEGIDGHAVLYPLNFLCAYDDLKPSVFEDSSGAFLGDEMFI